MRIIFTKFHSPYYCVPAFGPQVGDRQNTKVLSITLSRSQVPLFCISKNYNMLSKMCEQGSTVHFGAGPLFKSKKSDVSLSQ